MGVLAMLAGRRAGRVIFFATELLIPRDDRLNFFLCRLRRIDLSNTKIRNAKPADRNTP